MSRRGYDVRMMVKQWVGEVTNSRGLRFRVFRTGDDRWYLFALLDADGCDTTVHFPVRKADLIPEARRALRAGVSFNLQAFRRLCAEPADTSNEATKPRPAGSAEGTS